MRISRLVSGVVVAGLVGVVPVAVSAPANAAALGSTTTLALSTPAEDITYRDSLSFSGNVRGSDGSAPLGGTASLQVFTAAAPVWTTIQTDSTASSYFFSDVTAGSNAQYKVVFGGAADSRNTYGPSESAPVSVAVQRKVKAKTKGLSVIGKVSPDYRKGKVKILVKKGKNFKKYKAFKTDKKGRFTFRAPKRNGFRFVVSIPGDATFAPVYNAYKVTVFG